MPQERAAPAAPGCSAEIRHMADEEPKQRRPRPEDRPRQRNPISSKTRAPVQVTPKERKRIALARSMEIRSETSPYMPNNTIEPDRIRSRAPPPRHGPNSALF